MRQVRLAGRWLVLSALLWGLVAGASAQVNTIAIGEEIRSAGSGFIDFEIVLVENQTVEISLRSDDFDTLIEVLDVEGDLIASDDDSGEGLDSLLEFTPQVSGVYTLRVRSFGAGADGSFTLGVHSIEGAVAAPGHFIAVNEEQTVSVAGSVDFSIDLRAGETVIFSAESDTIDPVMEVFDPSNTAVASDDDGGEGLNALLEFTPLQTGLYTVQIRTFDTSQTGDLTFSVMEPIIDARSADLTVGESFAGRLATGQQELTVFLAGSQTFDIRLASADFDPTLTLLDSEGNQVAFNDDANDSLNSHIIFTPNSNGLFTMVVSSFGGDASGSFTLTVARREAVEGLPISIGEELTDVASGRVVYEIRLVEDDTIAIALSSDDFDPALELQDAEQRIIRTDDDGGQGLQAFINFTAPRSGIYFIVVDSFASEPNGSYTLSVQVPVDAGGPIAYGETLLIDPLNAVNTTFTFQGQAGDVVDISVVSTGDEDSRLFLFDESDNQVAEDDDGGPGTNPFIRRAELPVSGTYTIQVQGFGETPLATSFEIMLEQTELISLNDGAVTINSAEVEREIIALDVQAGTTYTLVVDADRTAESSLFVSLNQEDGFSFRNFSAANFDSITFVFTPEESGTLTIDFNYSAFSEEGVIFTVKAGS